ncbi:DUF3352 domain-containing protein [Winogradskyella undariae]|uniref:DUF3352 domain-containing protein n=1 Tax=Winogradskyella undariae TaxID=1285465 RepID=UPI00156BC124|nr:DUF3352 domain-containing protein [Winogradskyella undariae]NRR91431.1 DUF3352 domain-containing protein [Winogradskyella undariae]
MTKRKSLFVILLVLISFLLYSFYTFYIDNNDNLKSIYLVPEDAVYIIETQDPIDNWNEVSKSDIWNHLNTNSYFNELAESLNKIDTIFKQEKSVFDRIGNREILISAHVYKPKKYDFFYVVDLQKIAKLNILKNHLNTFTNSNYKISKRKYHNQEIIEVYDVIKRETLHISFIKNQMIASYVHTLVEASIDQYKEPKIGRNLDFIEVEKEVGYGDMFRLYVQYKYLDEYLKVFSNDSGALTKTLSNSLHFSGFNFDVDDNTITANGITNYDEAVSLYLKSLQNSGHSSRKIAEIAPKQTALYLSFTFDSFEKFYTNFENVLKEKPEEFKSYLDGTEQIENFLKIDLKKNFVSWVDDEIALIQLHSTVTDSKKDVAFILKTTDIDDAKKNLDFILEQIRRRSPVKFKEVSYKGHTINFMDIKGFFKILLGDLFKEIDKPYFTIIDDYVVFSNHPNTLKSIITSYINEDTLANFESFEDFDNNFDSRSNVFAYINAPNLYNSAYNFLDATTRKELSDNKDYFICFSQIGIQLKSEDDLFETKLVVDYEDPETVKTKYSFTDSSSKTKGNQTKNEVEITEETINKATIFTIKEIFPSDLTAKQFEKKYYNGKIRFSVELKNGLKHGDYLEYYSNGKLKIKGSYKRDQQNGTWRIYDYNEDVVFKKRF